MYNRVVTNENKALLEKGKDIMAGFDRKVLINQEFLDSLMASDIRKWEYFDYADDKGYRILDASALQWMNIAGNSGDGKTQSTHFSAFDKKYFDTFHDSHLMRDLDDPKLVPHQYHLRALTKAEESIKTARKGIQKREKEAVEQRQNARFNAQTVVKANKSLTNELKALMPEKSDEEMTKVVNHFLKMGEVKGKQSDDLHFFDY